MKTQGFTLIELLAVIVILAIIALIATPIVLGIIDDTKESAQIRSAEMYLKGVANAVMKENLEQEGNFKPTECTITSEGNLDCDDKEGILEVEVDGEKPKNGTITFTEGKIKEVTLKYETSTIVKNEEGNLVYSDEESGSSSGELDMSTVSSTLEENDWETIQKVVKAGKVDESSWSVGDTKTLTINGSEKTATLIGINHDGEQTATFMVMSNIGSRVMNSTDTNAGGWEASEMRAWLNGDIYNSMSNKDYIKEVTKMTNNVGYEGNVATITSDKVFLLSPKEVGLEWQITHDDYWGCPDYPYINVINSEGTTYDWFKTNSIDDFFWLRSPSSDSYDYFFSYTFSSFSGNYASNEDSVFVAFVIG